MPHTEPEPPDPRVGQVWQLLWDEEATPVLVIDVDDKTVDVLPVVEDPSMAVYPALVTGRGESPVGYASAVWSIPRATIPWCVLNRYYGNADLSGLRYDPAATHDLHPDDPRAAEVARLNDILTSFAAIDPATASAVVGAWMGGVEPSPRVTGDASIGSGRTSR